MFHLRVAAEGEETVSAELAAFREQREIENEAFTEVLGGTIPRKPTSLFVRTQTDREYSQNTCTLPSSR